MSDKPEGPGWWIASDGNWYPPELHPSVREGTRMRSPVDTPVRPAGQDPGGTPAGSGESLHPSRWQGNSNANQGTRVGPQFPDLFQKALQGSHLADNVTVANIADDASAGSFSSSRAAGSSRDAAPVGASSGSTNRRKWRKGH